MTIPGLNLNLESEIPVYRQIAEGVRAGLADGRLRPGSPHRGEASPA